jgi:acyl-CoA dehydrogenase
MDFDFSPEQYSLRDEARRFLEQQCPTSHVREFIDDPAGWSRDLWKQMADLGWMALPFPEEYGGLGQSFLDLVLLLGELGRAVAPVPYLPSVVWAGQTILHHGSDEQKRRWLPGIASGDRVAALALAEPGTSMDGSGVETRAERAADGSWRLNGVKPLVVGAPAADCFVVAAQDGEGLRWFLAGDGAQVTPRQAFDLTRPLGSVTFEGAPAEPLERPGLEPAWRICVASVCAEMVGVAQKVLDLTVEYTKAREQFGRPIGSFQAIKHRCAEMLTEIEAARAATSYACWAVATDAEDVDVWASIAKSYCAEGLGSFVAGEGIQVHGGIAFTWEHDMHLYTRRLKSLEALFGDAAFHRERLCRMVGL